MKPKVLIVEDEFVIGLALEEAVVEAGFELTGLVTSKAEAFQISNPVDIALVDVNLLDGPTGPDIGRHLAERGTSVVFMTGNPEMLESGVPGAIGVMTKPVRDLDLVVLLHYIDERHRGRKAIPPRALKLFG